MTAVLIAGTVVSVWLNYLWLQTVEQSLKTNEPITLTNIDSNLYKQILEKIDAKQKIPVPKVEEIREIMLLTPSPNTNVPTVKTNSVR